MPNLATMFSLRKHTIAGSERFPRTLRETILVKVNCAIMTRSLYRSTAISRLHQACRKTSDSNLPTRKWIRRATHPSLAQSSTSNHHCYQITEKRKLKATCDFEPNLRNEFRGD